VEGKGLFLGGSGFLGSLGKKKLTFEGKRGESGGADAPRKKTGFYWAELHKEKREIRVGNIECLEGDTREKKKAERLGEKEPGAEEGDKNSR